MTENGNRFARVYLTPAHPSHLHMQSDATSDPQSHPTKQRKLANILARIGLPGHGLGIAPAVFRYPGHAPRSSNVVPHRPRRASQVFECPLRAGASMSQGSNCHLHALRLSWTDREAQMMTPANFRLLLAKSRWLVKWSVHRLHCGYNCGTRVDALDVTYSICFSPGIHMRREASPTEETEYPQSKSPGRVG